MDLEWHPGVVIVTNPPDSLDFLIDEEGIDGIEYDKEGRAVIRYDEGVWSEDDLRTRLQDLS